MHSSTITAFLLPLLLSSVLAVPTPVQNGAPAHSSPPAEQANLENGLMKSGHPEEAAWVASSPSRKRSIIGVQESNEQYEKDGDAPAVVDPTAGETTEDLDDEKGMASEAHAQATGQDQDPTSCYEDCGHSLKGRQFDDAASYVAQGDTAPAAVDPKAGESTEDLDDEKGMASEATAQATGQDHDPYGYNESSKRALKGRQDDSDDDSPAPADPNAGLTTEDLDVEAGIESEDHAQAMGEDPSLCYKSSCGRSLKGRQDDSEAATTPATHTN